MLKIVGWLVVLSAVAGPLEAQNSISPAPKNIMPQIIKYLRGAMKDPYSMRDMRVCAPKADGSGWTVDFQMNAKNNYGGYVGATYSSATFVNGIIDHVGSPDLGPDLNAKLLSLTAVCRAIPDTEIRRLLKAAN